MPVRPIDECGRGLANPQSPPACSPQAPGAPTTPARLNPLRPSRRSTDAPAIEAFPPESLVSERAPQVVPCGYGKRNHSLPAPASPIPETPSVESFLAAQVPQGRNVRQREIEPVLVFIAHRS